MHKSQKLPSFILKKNNSFELLPDWCVYYSWKGGMANKGISQVLGKLDFSET